jgi:hypothetical protein
MAVPEVLPAPLFLFPCAGKPRSVPEPNTGAMNLSEEDQNNE